MRTQTQASMAARSACSGRNLIDWRYGASTFSSPIYFSSFPSDPLSPPAPFDDFFSSPPDSSDPPPMRPKFMIPPVARSSPFSLCSFARRISCWM